VVEVTDTGIGHGLGSARPGLGQLGMHERVTAVGGTLHTGPRARGGYLVRARIPA
jgi:signal transduction histidine kinase